MISFENNWRAGVIPAMLYEDDPHGAVEQLNENYAHGGGWVPFKEFTMVDSYGLYYEGDPTIYPVASGTLHGNEIVLVYPFGWVAVVQKAGGSYVVARMD
jgi:hypothetical protein